MPTITITNQKAAQSLRGESCRITVNLATQSTEFGQLKVGQLCTNAQSGAEGYIQRIDTYGNTFDIGPRMPSKDLSNTDAGKIGYFAASTNVSITV